MVHTKNLNAIDVLDLDSPVFANKIDGAVLLRVYIQPNSVTTSIVGIHDTYLKIKIAAPALDNKANKELCNFIAKKMQLPKTKISIIKGNTSRKKTVKILL